MNDTTPLGAKLRAAIVQNGPMPFHDYIAACLYDPDHGYYVRANALGRGGDFITAPEISQTFGELIGLWAYAAWANMGRPDGVRLIELGPGRGTSMADALRALAAVAPDFVAAVSVHLVEASATLQARQREKLAVAPCPLFWHGDLEGVPEGPALIVANEFFDCLPVRQYIYREDGGWRERYVAFEAGGFVFSDGPQAFPSVDADLLLEEGAIYEARPGSTVLLQEFARRAPLAALLIDYGYGRPSLGDTVQAVQAHTFVDVFHAPGASDLTAHVDFHRLQNEARKTGLAAFGPMPMGEWLLRMGIAARAERLSQAAASQQAAQAILSGMKRLVDPAQMGVLFKVLMLTQGDFSPPPPFQA